MIGWIEHSVHEQVDIVRPVFEIIEWFEVAETVHDLIKVLIERGLNDSGVRMRVGFGEGL